MRRFCVPIILLVLTGCFHGSPYAFRLMMPPTAHPWAVYLPFWFWKEADVVSVFEKFTECEKARQGLMAPILKHALEKIKIEETEWPVMDEVVNKALNDPAFPLSFRKTMLRQWRARCVPLR